jgi:hypothetical protein
VIFLLKESVEGIHLNVPAEFIEVVLSLINNFVDGIDRLVISKEFIDSSIVSIDDWEPSVSEVLEAGSVWASLSEGFFERLAIHFSESLEVVAGVPFVLITSAIFLLPIVILSHVGPHGASLLSALTLSFIIAVFVPAVAVLIALLEVALIHGVVPMTALLIVVVLITRCLMEASILVVPLSEALRFL